MQSRQFSIVKPKSRKREKLVSARAAHQKHVFPTLKNQSESSIYEAISLISIDDSLVKLKRNGEPNNQYLHLETGTDK